MPRWLVKLDDESGGRGIAHVDAAHVPSRAKALAARRRRESGHPPRPPTEGGEGGEEGEDASQARLDAELRQELAELLPFRAVLSAPWLYRSWAEFVVALGRTGGVIEALPPKAGWRIRKASVQKVRQSP